MVRMKPQEVVNGRALRLTRREPDGHWVRDVTTGRTLGVVWRLNSRWHWRPAVSAFRGDGRSGHETDGNLGDYVPSHLTDDVTGDISLRRDACELLIQYLEAQRAPALGYGPHPDVTICDHEKG